MKHTIFILLISLTTSFSAFAQSRAVSCGVNCYDIDFNGDQKNTRIELVMGKVNLDQGTHELNVKITEPAQSPAYISVTKNAVMGGNFKLTVMDVNQDKHEDITCQWTPHDRNEGAVRQFLNDGSGNFGHKAKPASTYRAPSSLRLEKK